MCSSDLVIKLPSGETRQILSACKATVGSVGNSDHALEQSGKAGRSRWLGRRPHNRGVVMNPVDHPMGGGEGRQSGPQYFPNLPAFFAEEHFAPILRRKYDVVFAIPLRSVYKELHADCETGAADNKLRLNTKHRKSARYSACFVVRGFQRGLPLGTRLCSQSVVCYTLCLRCRENAIAAG